MFSHLGFLLLSELSAHNQDSVVEVSTQYRSEVPINTSILSCESFYRKHGGDGSSSECAKSSESDRQQLLAAGTEWQLSSTDSCATEQLYLQSTLLTPIRQGPRKGGLKMAPLKPSSQQETGSVRTFLLLLWRILHYWNRKARSFSHRTLAWALGTKAKWSINWIIYTIPQRNLINPFTYIHIKKTQQQVGVQFKLNEQEEWYGKGNKIFWSVTPDEILEFYSSHYY